MHARRLRARAAIEDEGDLSAVVDEEVMLIDLP